MLELNGDVQQILSPRLYEEYPARTPAHCFQFEFEKTRGNAERQADTKEKRKRKRDPDVSRIANSTGICIIKQVFRLKKSTWGCGHYSPSQSHEASWSLVVPGNFGDIHYSTMSKSCSSNGGALLLYMYVHTYPIPHSPRKSAQKMSCPILV